MYKGYSYRPYIGYTYRLYIQVIHIGYTYKHIHNTVQAIHRLYIQPIHIGYTQAIHRLYIQVIHIGFTQAIHIGCTQAIYIRVFDFGSSIYPPTLYSNDCIYSMTFLTTFNLYVYSIPHPNYQLHNMTIKQRVSVPGNVWTVQTGRTSILDS